MKDTYPRKLSALFLILLLTWISFNPCIEGYSNYEYNRSNDKETLNIANLKKNVGIIDLAITNADSNDVSILIGLGNGSFWKHKDYSVGMYPNDIISGDFNNDNILDLAITNYHNSTINVLFGNGDGSFGNYKNYTVGIQPKSLITNDFNNDGFLDIVTANLVGHNICILLNYGNGTFYSHRHYSMGSPYELVSGDFNYDNNTDIAVTKSGGIQLMRGDGNGNFNYSYEYNLGTHTYSIETGDFNRDHILDLAITNLEQDNISILYGEPGGSFGNRHDYDVGDTPRDILTADFNKDEILDLAVANVNSDEISILFGNDIGGFGNRTDYHVSFRPMNLVSEDFNLDGVLDLAVTTYFNDKVFILLGNGDGSFEIQYEIEVGEYPIGITAGNFNNKNESPSVSIVNPKEGYFHFSGIPLLPTPFDLIADTMSIGGFRLRPVIINATDAFDKSEDLIVKVYLNYEEQGNASYCCDWRLHEWFWTGWALGTYTLTITAENSFGAIGSVEMEVWNFCFLP